MKVICTRTEPCHMCDHRGIDAVNQLVKGRAYTVTAELKDGDKHGFQLAEVPPMFDRWGARMWHCAPHFTEITAADQDIFEMADRPIILEDA